jgi:cation diffusion facilitator family transporter
LPELGALFRATILECFISAVPLWLAFRLVRRAPTSRFTYGDGKAEDVAGVVVLALIFGSAAFAGYEAIDRLINPQKITYLGFVMAAAVVGAVGNEVVAQYRIRVGRRLGSAAREADGIHARTDWCSSAPSRGLSEPNGRIRLWAW